MKDIKYYDKESAVYSSKRYPLQSFCFTHFLFKRRLLILINRLNKITKHKKGKLSLLEIGCADGIVLREIRKNINCFSELIGVDISPNMIKIAKNSSKNNIIKFYVRKEGDSFNQKFDVIVEIGVLNLVNIDQEFRYVYKHLKKDGYYICSFASKTSLKSFLSNIFLKQNIAENFKHLLSFKDYEREIKKFFVVIDIVPYGLFIPYIWKIPSLAIFVQRFVEFLFRNLFVLDNLFHEKIYILKKK